MEQLESGKELNKIKKVHFLIHPGFVSHFFDNFAYLKKKISKEDLKDYVLLLDKYVNQAKALNDKENELFVVFTHTDSSSLRLGIELGRLYTQKIREMKGILGKRMIVISNDHDVRSDKDIFGVVESIAKRRGFVIDKNVISEAYGEMLGLCVDQGANNLNRSGNLVEKTIINTKLTGKKLNLEKESVRGSNIANTERIIYE